ncbi:ABC transporter [Paenibacillus swuensis]|uniref:ABC transporter n=1 Tax=Paenibacillus swuensis TaxID=1178515 RepID=A0A172TLA2_9BACL|nr:ABC transporter ATP-binding protein [Paenibacillus swuensis]ANE47694.1 ABC transporter [Paenibacillus swuensis]
MIHVNGLSKTYKVAKRSSGFMEAAKALIHREYTTVQALDQVSFDIEPGEIVGYIGPNGAGKSTTIKMLSGILVPDEGTCSILGYTPWRDRVRYVSRIGVVFGQRSQLWWDVPVLDSFELLRDIYSIPSEEYKRNLSLLTETLNLAELLQTPVRQLSLGQRMRCEIAASLLHSPQVLFLDEPTIGLDAVSKIAVRQFIQTINQEKGITVILTTHDMNDIEALAHRIILIGKGRLLYDGNLQSLRQSYSPAKTITVDHQECNITLQIPSATSITSSSRRTVLQVPTQHVSDVLSKLSDQLEITDISIDGQPVEELILQLYKEYQL